MNNNLYNIVIYLIAALCFVAIILNVFLIIARGYGFYPKPKWIMYASISSVLFLIVAVIFRPILSEGVFPWIILSVFTWQSIYSLIRPSYIYIMPNGYTGELTKNNIFQVAIGNETLIIVSNNRFFSILKLEKRLTYGKAIACIWSSQWILFSTICFGYISSILVNKL